MNSPMIRTASEADLRAIHDVYNFYVATSTCTYQLEPEQFEDRVAWYTSHGERHPVIVAESAGEVIGWGSLSPWKERAGYAGTVEASVYVHHDWHRRGVGKAILSELIERARTLGHHVLIGGHAPSIPGASHSKKALDSNASRTSERRDASSTAGSMSSTCR